MIWIIFAFALILGAIFASFFGVIIYRVPRGESIVRPASHCGSCGRTIRWYDNIPVLSFIALRGKCRYCGERIGWFSLIYEVLGAVALGLTVLRFGVSYLTIFMVVIVLILYFIAGYDYRTQVILDPAWMSLAAVCIGTFFFQVFYLHQDYVSLLIGSAIGFGFFGLIKIVGRLILKEECLGGGDVILMGVTGLILGWFNIILAVFVGSAVGSIIELILLKTGRKKKQPIAFGPYLVLGIFTALMVGDILFSLITGVTN